MVHGVHSSANTVVLASYNIHSCIGADRQFSPTRVATVIGELGADIVALQEVAARNRATSDVDQWRFLADALDCHCVRGISQQVAGRPFGNAVLTRWPVGTVRLHDLSVERREPRSAIDLDLIVHGRPLRVIATHLGLRRAERQFQAELLIKILAQQAKATATVLLGDLNEWRPVRNGILPLLRQFDPVLAPATFPSRYPVLALDRILARDGVELRDVRTHPTLLARLASDHLPLRAVGVWQSSMVDSTISESTV
jgi:endonuclease/exonuclease/phosphatase family metal-dependent hydrolase